MYSLEQTDRQLLGTTAHIRYHLHFEHAHRHIVRIVMEVDTERDGALVLGLPVWIPGSYKIRDYISTLGSFTIVNHDGIALQWEWIAKNRLQIQAHRGTVRIEYVFYAYEKDSTIRSSHVTRTHAFLNPVTCCMFVEGREYEIHHCYFHHDRTQWRHISTALSPIKKEFSSSEPLVLGALNYDILVDSPIEIGNHFIARFEYQGSLIETAIVYRGNCNPAWLAERMQTIVECEARIFGELPFDRYVCIIHLIPGMRGGGLEHARSSVNAIDSWNDTTKLHRLLSLLVHEFFHVWNGKRIRPLELGPFNYNKENYTRMLWLVEGATSYYDDFLSYRCGFYTRDEYLTILSRDHLTPFFRQPGRNEASIRDNSFQAWVKLYLPHDDSINRNVSYYLHGGLIFLCLELWIISESGGKKRLDDGFRALWKRYKEHPERGITEEEFIVLMEDATHVPIRDALTQWLSGRGDELPIEQLFKRVGIEWKESSSTSPAVIGEGIPSMPLHKKPFTGLTLRAEQGRLFVAQVEAYSPAYDAAIGVDDEILCVNGMRCTCVEEFETALAQKGIGESSEILIASDYTLTTVYLKPTPLLERVLVVREDATPDQQALLEYWLAR
ncbi:MAG: hypothetical protein RML40_00455 [Bacteroidota bacterium]|nr:hypothetical protein [Candidatus Kapabacteria bacterium]MDW8218977.1 hypothetical protein [Bacteroidota bacterium]